MNLVLSFADKEVLTLVYIKVDAADQLLLSEGICSLLGIVEYHPEVEAWRGGCRSKRSDTQPRVPTVRVTLVTSVKVLPQQKVLAPIEAVRKQSANTKCLLESDSSGVIQAERSFVTLQSDGQAQTVLVNMTGFTQTLPAGTVIGTVSECEKVQASVNKIQGGSEVRVN